MPAKQTLAEYEKILGEKITGVAHEKFNNASAHDYIKVKCECGEIFSSKRVDLTARFHRGNNIECSSCVNKKNIAKRYENGGNTLQND